MILTMSEHERERYLREKFPEAPRPGVLKRLSAWWTGLWGQA